MIYTFKFQDQIYKINLEEEGKETEVEIEGKKIPVEFQKIDENFYSILLGGKSIGVGILKRGKRVDVFVEGDLYEFESISDREREGKGGRLGGSRDKIPDAKPCRKDP